MRYRSWTFVKWAALATSLGSILLAGLLMWQAGPSTPLEVPSTQPDAGQTQVQSPVIVERKDGRVVWQLRAGEAKQQLNGQMLLSRPELTLFTESGSSAPIKSQRATFDALRRNIRFEGKVQVSYQTWELRSEQVEYNSSKDEIIVPGEFTLRGQSLVAHGGKMRIDRSAEQLFVNGGIRIDDSNPAWTGSGT